jgi:hypothetical protein
MPGTPVAPLPGRRAQKFSLYSDFKETTKDLESYKRKMEGTTRSFFAARPPTAVKKRTKWSGPCSGQKDSQDTCRARGFLVGSCSLMGVCLAWLQHPAVWRNGLGRRSRPAGWSSACGSRQGISWKWSGACGWVTCERQLFSLRICQTCARPPWSSDGRGPGSGAGPLMVQHLWLAPQEWSGWLVSSMRGDAWP